MLFRSGGVSGKPRYHYHGAGPGGAGHYPAPNPGMFSPTGSKNVAANANANVNANVNVKKPNGQPQQKPAEDGGRDLHMFVWSSSASPVSDVFGGHEYANNDQKEVRLAVSPGKGQ